MGGISTSTGLVSGLPIHDIVDQLMGVEARPRDLVVKRNEELETQQTALQEVNSALLGLREAASALTHTSLFRNTTATSSNENVLTASTGAGAVPGNYNFHVHQLVSAQQNLTRGFSDADRTTFGAATLSFDRGGARLDATTELSRLNAGEGIERGQIRITDRSGSRETIDLSTAVTVNDVLDAINDSLGVNVTARIDGDRITITDNTGQANANLTIENVGGRQTATTLGLAQSVSEDTLAGAQINTVGRATQLSRLNDGTGVGIHPDEPDFRIQSANGSNYDIDLAGARSLGEVIDAINQATGGQVRADIGDDGVSLKLTDQAGGGGDFAVTALHGSSAAEDLGIRGSDEHGTGEITGDRLVAAINSKLTRMLNGGAGVGLGTISITDRAGTTDDIDLSGADSISAIIERINAGDAAVTATINSAGNGISLTDRSGGSGTIRIGDVNGSAAADLGLAGEHDAGTLDSGSLALQYIAEGTRLERLGVASGSIIVTDSTGKSATINVDASDGRTLGDVIRQINSRSSINVTARVNDQGNGILLQDDAGGSVPISVEDAGSTTARDLGLRGQAEEAGADLNGSFARTIEVEAGDTLNDIVNRINSEGFEVRASIVNDGSDAAPYRLLLAAREGGTDNAFVFDDGGLGLDASTFTEARDATVFYGAANPADALALRSRTNQIKGVIPDTTIDLKSTSSQPVQLTIERDHEAVVEKVQEFVEKFNGVIEKMDEYDYYDADKNERGILFGDSAVNTVRRTIYSQLNMRSDEVDGQFKSLTELGITVGSGGVVELDDSTLRSALQDDLDSVRRLFTLRESQTDEQTGERELTRAGIGVRIEEALRRLTDREFGSFYRQISTLDRQIDLNDQRIESLNDRLASRRQQLLSQFYAMEQAIAGMQQQSESLLGLRNLVEQGR